VNRISAIVAIAAISVAFGGEAGAAEDAPASRAVAIPLANPLKGFDASTIAWNSATQIFDASTQSIATALNWDESLEGRFAYLALAGYFDYATGYYSHETAHFFHQKTDTRHFWLDLANWSPFVPSFIKTPWADCWDARELQEYVYSNNPDLDAKVRKWLILMGESGLYQEKCNARLVARLSSRKGGTEISNAISFILNHMSDAAYNMSYGTEPIGVIRNGSYNLKHDNDISRYLITMEAMGIMISRDDWLISSVLAFAASGQTWNSARAGYRYMAHGQRSVDNLAWSISDRIALSPPNFYLFSTYRGLYLESEMCIGIPSPANKRVNMVLGTGLDSFGLQRTGAVDWLRVGGRYDSIDLDLRFITLSLSPYCYADLTRGLKHRGQSLGAEIFCPLGARFSLQGTIEYNKNDILEGVIKNKDEGMYFLVAAGLNLQKGSSAQ
jgi:hypothetical protein